LRTWVIGTGGLLGRAVAADANSTFAGARIPWSEPERAREVLLRDAVRFASEVGDDPWSVVWAAGAGVVGTARAALRAETASLGSVVDGLLSELPRGDGSFFLASSAGGVYAGSVGPPFDETSEPRPLSDYGESKLEQEALVAERLGGRVPVLIGRLTNLYGPGQNLTKPQGLISQLCIAAARRTTLNLFVPMETLRDYLFVDDAARMIREWATAASRAGGRGVEIRNLASERPVTVGAVVRTVQQVARRPVRVGLGASAVSGLHVRDLRVRSAVPAVTTWELTPLPVGVKRVYDHTLTIVRRTVTRDT
jgi:UDP-glucose 4-epimerase